MKYKFFTFFILLLGSINAAEKPFVVYLETEEKLVPLTLLPFEGDSLHYLKQLQEVLLFDLNYNGATQASMGQAPSAYRISVLVKGGDLTAKLKSNNGEFERVMDGIKITGQLPIDRRIIHQLADSIYQILFDSEGIATTRILYTMRKSGREDEMAEVWEADYDGHNSRQVTKEEDHCVTPCYLPSQCGKTSGAFCYVSFRTGQTKIYVASLKEGTGRRLVHMGGNQLMPAFSRKRDQIAFVSDIGGNPDLFVQPFSPELGVVGKPQQIFTRQLAVQGTPTFSPNGDRLAFVSNKDGLPRIYLMMIPAAGAQLKNIKPQLITKYNRECTAPAWSPDGTKLAYCSLIEGVRQICIYDFAKKEERQLTKGLGNKENPTWSPNSLCLVYNISDSGAVDLFLMTIKEPRPIKITRGIGEKRYPSWEPRF